MQTTQQPINRIAAYEQRPPLNLWKAVAILTLCCCCLLMGMLLAAVYVPLLTDTRLMDSEPIHYTVHQWPKTNTSSSGPIEVSSTDTGKSLPTPDKPIDLPPVLPNPSPTPAPLLITSQSSTPMVQFIPIKPAESVEDLTVVIVVPEVPEPKQRVVIFDSRAERLLREHRERAYRLRTMPGSLPGNWDERD